MWVSWCENKSFWQRFTCNEEETDEYNNESLDWYEPEVYEESFDEDPPTKKRGRPPKHKIEGIYLPFWKEIYSLYRQKCNF